MTTHISTAAAKKPHAAHSGKTPKKPEDKKNTDNNNSNASLQDTPSSNGDRSQLETSQAGLDSKTQFQLTQNLKPTQPVAQTTALPASQSDAPAPASSPSAQPAAQTTALPASQSDAPAPASSPSAQPAAQTTALPGSQQVLPSAQPAAQTTALPGSQQAVPSAQPVAQSTALSGGDAVMPAIDPSTGQFSPPAKMQTPLPFWATQGFVDITNGKKYVAVTDPNTGQLVPSIQSSDGRIPDPAFPDAASMANLRPVIMIADVTTEGWVPSVPSANGDLVPAIYDPAQQKMVPGAVNAYGLEVVPKVVDPATGKVLPANIDPSQVSVSNPEPDPQNGQPIQHMVDAITGGTVPLIMSPNGKFFATAIPDPKTGSFVPAALDPDSGQVVPGQFNPETGQVEPSTSSTATPPATETPGTSQGDYWETDANGKTQANANKFNTEFADYNKSLPPDQQLTPEQLVDAEVLNSKIIDGAPNMKNNQMIPKGNLNGDLLTSTSPETTAALQASLTPEKAMQIYKFQAELQSTGQVKTTPHSLYRSFLDPNRTGSFPPEYLADPAKLQATILNNDPNSWELTKDGRIAKVVKNEQGLITGKFGVRPDPVTGVLEITTYIPIGKSKRGRYAPGKTNYLDPAETPVANLPPAAAGANPGSAAGGNAEDPSTAEIVADEQAMTPAQETAEANQVSETLQQAGIISPEQAAQDQAGLQTAVNNDAPPDSQALQNLEEAGAAIDGSEGAAWVRANPAEVIKAARGAAQLLGKAGVVVGAGITAKDVAKFVYYLARGNAQKTKETYDDIMKFGFSTGAAIAGGEAGGAGGAIIGSAVGPVGIVIGGIIGATVGGIAGFFGGDGIWHWAHGNNKPPILHPRVPPGSNPTP